MNHINNYILKQNKYILKNKLLFWEKKRRWELVYK